MEIRNPTKCNRIRVGDYVEYKEEKKIVHAVSCGSVILFDLAEKEIKDAEKLEYGPWIDLDEISLIENTINIFD